jgi:hypothetical protein
LPTILSVCPARLPAVESVELLEELIGESLDHGGSALEMEMYASKTHLD